VKEKYFGKKKPVSLLKNVKSYFGPKRKDFLLFWSGVMKQRERERERERERVW